MAEEVQGHEELWHQAAFAGGEGKRAIDSIMLAKDMLQENSDLRRVGRDIKSAFNGLRIAIITERLHKHCALQQWVEEFLLPCHIDIHVEGKLVHTTIMAEGIPQGSSLSHSLFSVYVSEMVCRAQSGLQQQLQWGRACLRPCNLSTAI